MEDPAVEQRDRAEPRADLLPGVRGRARPALRARRRSRRSAAAGPRPGRRSRCPTRRSACGFTEAVRGRALAPHGDPRRQDRELPPVPADPVERQRRATPTAPRARTRTRCRTRRSSRRTRRTTSRASTSCGRCAASTRACRAVCTCTSATAARSAPALAAHRGPALLTGTAAMNRRELQNQSQQVEEVLDEFAQRRRRGGAGARRRLVRSVMALHGVGPRTGRRGR